MTEQQIRNRLQAILTAIEECLRTIESEKRRLADLREEKRRLVWMNPDPEVTK